MIVTNEDFWVFIGLLAGVFALGAAASAIVLNMRHLQKTEALYDMLRKAKKEEQKARERLFKHVSGGVK